MNAPHPKPHLTGLQFLHWFFSHCGCDCNSLYMPFQHDFSLAAWISMFVLLGVSSLGITAGYYHRLWAHCAYEASLPLKIILMIMGTFAAKQYFILEFRSPYPPLPCR